MTKVIAILSLLKGSAASGHYDHEGRPGKVGGSQPKNGKAGDGESSIYLDSYDEVESYKDGSKGYFITGEDKLVDIIGDFGPGSNDHVGAFVAMENPEIVGLTKDDAKEFERLYTEGDTALMDYWEKIHKSGVIRVREFGKNVYIDTYEMDRSTLRRLQRLMDDGLIKFYPGKENIWTSSDNYFSDIRFTYEDIIDAGNIDIDAGKLKEFTMAKLKLKEAKMAKLKVKVKKGGPGSGNFGHAGRPGKVGGSAAGGGGKGKGKGGKKVEGGGDPILQQGWLDVMDDEEHMMTAQVYSLTMPTVDAAEFVLYDLLLSNTEIEDIKFDEFEDLEIKPMLDELGEPYSDAWQISASVNPLNPIIKKSKVLAKLKRRITFIKDN